ncbi:Interferon-inducible GTPase 5 [Chelonia mydas]|uniref:Interferon-inducible GTPase 5 n=1 Tax=Chelonia mydas TaxID=8469 RepID=M7AYP8_CHEMY|nr:Interferon-inducible GTPase 5 [Chelonia mydas]
MQSLELREQDLTEMGSLIQSRVVLEVCTQVQTLLDSLDSATLDIAVTGESGAGKSTLVNALRGLSDSDPRAAPTGPMRVVAAEFDASEANKSPVRLQAQPHSLPVTMQGSLVLSLLAVLLAAANGQASYFLFWFSGLNEDGTQYTFFYKECLNTYKSDIEVPISFTVGNGQYVRINTTRCNDTDNCNSGTLEVPTGSTTENGRQCPTCFALNFTVCNSSITPCTGDETYCLDFTGFLKKGLTEGSQLRQVNVNEMSQS